MPNNRTMNVIKLIEDLGGTSAVADLCGVRAPSVSGWRAAGRIPDDKLIRLAPIAEARGVSTRKELFPDDWQDIWPELAQAQPAPAPAGNGAIAVVVEAVNAVVQDAREQIHKLEVHAEVEIKHAALDMLAEVATAQQAALAAWDGKERRNLPWNGEEHREGEADRRKYEVLGSPDVAADKRTGQGVA